MPTVIFDLDGTLCDLSHRLHHIKEKPIDWAMFFDKCDNDRPIDPVCRLARMIGNHAYQIVIVSGRSDVVRGKTEAWLEKHQIPYHLLIMRKDGDYRADDIVKEEILDSLLPNHDILFVVDDRQRVVDMWRRRGITCLQSAAWNEEAPKAPPGLLTIMVGPSGAGKSTWLQNSASDYGIKAAHIVSSDQIREDICGNFRDQTKNDEVFAALHAVVKCRISHGLPTVIDATNLKRKDRLSVASLSNGGKVRYIVIDRPMPEKIRDAGWRLSLPINLLEKHQQTFNSQIKDILAGDKQPNVEVIDLRRAA